MISAVAMGLVYAYLSLTALGRRRPGQAYAASQKDTRIKVLFGMLAATGILFVFALLEIWIRTGF
jgi:hypothetical protein